MTARDAGSSVQHSSQSSLKYMPGLDVVRGLAILAVVVYHGLGSKVEFFQAFHARWAMILQGTLECGGWGVHLFFVLSGFLISGILLEQRDSPTYYRDFYLRRLLRIVPAYVVLLLVLFFSHTISAPYLAIALLYLVNVARVFGVGHEYATLWSLSVEEQFYLVWPWVTRHTTRRQLKGLCVILLAGVPCVRLAVLLLSHGAADVYSKTWAVADFFAAGTLLALAVRSPRPLVHSRLGKMVLPLLLGFAVLDLVAVLAPQADRTLPGYVALALAPVPWLLLSSALVLIGCQKPSLARRGLFRPLTSLARVSYGLYLCHQLIFHLVEARWTVPSDGRLVSLTSLLLRFLVAAGLAVGVATLSRNTLEAYFLRLKPKFKPVPHGSIPPLSLDSNAGRGA